jgi:simple sugar transport system permease protein
VTRWTDRLREGLVTLLRALVVPVVAVVLALAIGAIIIAASGSDPLRAYLALYQGSFAFGTPQSARAFGRTLEKATPLIFSGLAVAFAFRGGLFNIGAQGQLLFGAMAAAIVGISFEGLPPVLHAGLALAVGALVGALWGALPGALKAYTGAHEVITTIMLNYVAINLTDYLADGPLKDRSPGNVVARTPAILPTARLEDIAGIPLGVILAVLFAVLVWWLIWRTTFGFAIRTVGQNPHAAAYAGIRVARMVILTMVISGLLAGFGGAVETQGVVGRFQPGFNVGLGFDGITVALLGKTHPLGVIPAAVIIGAMKAGSSNMSFESGVAKEITDVIQALLLFFVAADVIIRRLLRMRTRPRERVELSTGWGG